MYRMLLGTVMIAVAGVTSAWADPVDLVCSGQRVEWAPEKKVLHSGTWRGVLDLGQGTFSTPAGVIKLSHYDERMVYFAPEGPARLGDWRGFLNRTTGEWTYLRSSEDQTIEGPAEGYEYLCKPAEQTS